MTADEYRSGDPFGNVRGIARDLDNRFSRPVGAVVPGPRRDSAGRFAKRTDDTFGPIAAGLVARDYVQPTGIRATLHRHFAWDLDEPLPIFREALAAVEAAS